MNSHRHVFTPGASPVTVQILQTFYFENIAALDPKV